MLISKAARDAVRARLAEAYQAALVEICTGYGIDPPAAIDFEDSRSRTFLQGMLAPGKITESTTVTYPLAVLYSLGSNNTNRTKFETFSGNVTVGLDIHLSWRPGNAVRDTESLGDAVEATLYRIFHDPEWEGACAEPLAYNGDMSIQRRPVEMDGTNWRQTISARLIFEIDSQA